MSDLDRPPSTKTTFLIMKMVAVMLIAIILAGLYARSEKDAPVGAQEDRYGVPTLGPVEARPPAMDIALHLIDYRTNLAQTQYVHDYKGRVLHINFWAGWCKPCASELPILEKLSKEFHDKYQVVLINLDSDAEAQKAARKEQELLAPHVLTMYGDNQKLEEDLNIAALPYHIVTDKNGRTAAAFMGALGTEEKDFKRLLLQLLAEAGPAGSSQPGL